MRIEMLFWYLGKYRKLFDSLISSFSAKIKLVAIVSLLRDSCDCYSPSTTTALSAVTILILDILRNVENYIS
jgi:hypothetical protein